MWKVVEDKVDKARMTEAEIEKIKERKNVKEKKEV